MALQPLENGVVACRIRNKIANRDVVKDFMAVFGCVQIKVNHLKLAFHRLTIIQRKVGPVLLLLRNYRRLWERDRDRKALHYL